MAVPSTRILSFAQMVREADPGYTRQSLQPWCYDFSNGRLFIDTLPTYTAFDIQDELFLLSNPGILLLMSDQPLFLVT